MALPKECIRLILPFLEKHHSEDDVHEMIIIAMEVLHIEKNSGINQIANDRIATYFKLRNRENHYLYNPWRNISINQSFGDNDIPISEWMNLTDWKEWD